MESEFFRVDKAHEELRAFSVCGAIKQTGFQSHTNSMTTYQEVAQYMLIIDWVRMLEIIEWDWLV